ncbi:MAG: mechanosensitive ion channel [Clostridia bacterium]|nr:mechanosensitive ion channel [Clostridia bacterium]
MWEKILNFLIDLATSFGIKLVGAIFVLVVGSKIINVFVKWLRRSHKLDKMDSSLRSFISSFSRIGLYILLVITVAMILGIPTTSFITALASCGVAIGLAMQGFLSNFAGGLMILIFKPFKVGDYIETVEESGTVEDISVVYTVLVTPDNKRVTVPNGSLTNMAITNYSVKDTRRVDLKFTASYDNDVEAVKKVIFDTVSAHPLILKEKEPFVRLNEHSDSALTYSVKVWCNNADYWTVYFDLVEGVKAAFDKNGIEIPYPQIDVHLDK